MIPIVPALIPKDEYEVIKAAGDWQFSREFHLDVVDGQFVPSTSWPIAPVGEPVAVGHTLRGFSLEVDLMVAHPAVVAQPWLEAGADRLVFHVETISVEALEQFASHSTASIGVSFHGDTTLEQFYEYITVADFVQVMGIREIGSQGQSFDARALEYVTAIKRDFPALSVTVDGSVNKDTIAAIVAAGADRLVVGSAIAKQDNPEQAWRELHALINHARL